MRKTFRLFGIVLVLALVTIQFLQPHKNKTENIESHIFTKERVPAPIQTMLNNACMDCHSNNTNYVWHNNISPISYLVNKHVIEGKDELNFSEWAAMDVFEKITILEKMCQETKRKTMPLKSYRSLHPKAKLSKEQIAELCAWSTKLAEDLLYQATKE